MICYITTIGHGYIKKKSIFYDIKCINYSQQTYLISLLKMSVLIIYHNIINIWIKYNYLIYMMLYILNNSRSIVFYYFIQQQYTRIHIKWVK